MEISITGMGDGGESEKIERASAALVVYDIDGEEGCLVTDEGGETDVAERAMLWMSLGFRAILSAMEACEECFGLDRAAACDLTMLALEAWKADYLIEKGDGE